MRLLNRILSATGIAIAATALVTGVAVADASVTVTPSTGLVDGQSVDVAVTGFGAAEELFVAQCAQPEPGVFLCDMVNVQSLTTDADGAGSVATTVHATFEGFDQTGSPVATVDCATVAGGCLLGAMNHTGSSAFAPISFQ